LMRVAKSVCADALVSNVPNRQKNIKNLRATLPSSCDIQDTLWRQSMFPAV